MANNITIDTSEITNNLKKLDKKLADALMPTYRLVADEILRLSQSEVPHDIGTLQNSGHAEDGQDEVIVGYNTPYAARLHEHPEYHFQKGRKGKYLEDPIKNNAQVLGKVIQDALLRLL